MDLKILKILAGNARTKSRDIASMVDKTEEEVKKEIEEMENNGIIRGYKGVIDWERVDKSAVSAIIELKVTPKAGRGFEEVAELVMKYPEVESVYLMSGTYDLNVVVKSKSFQEVALFVARELATIDSVTSTTTHFVLRRYKELDVELCNTDNDDRGNFFL